MTLESEDALVPQTWDGFWRIILLDLPENRKSERESLRYLLKKAGFVCLKNSAWISPFPYEHLFTNIKKDLGLTTEMMIIITQFIDEETKKVLFESFGK
jgi:DNA-binding transcriptional regulator PaaX